MTFQTIHSPGDPIRMTWIRRFAGCLAILCAVPLALLAQGGGSVTGILRDADAAPMAGVPVSVAKVEGEGMFEGSTNEQGVFHVAGLPPGPYRVQVEGGGARLDFRVEMVQAGQRIDLGALVLAGGAGPVQAAVPVPAQAEAGKAESLQKVYEEITVTARRVEEGAQSVPIPLTVVTGEVVEKAGAFNVNRLKELIPSVQFYSSNPRNSAINIRGLGAPFGLTNDGIEPGVGLYIDGVFYARPASATLDFLDLERIEVLRGPQGTLFGKNTTAGAIHVTSRKPSFTPETNFELNYGNFGFVQAKGSVSGPLGKKVAGRISFSGTQRDGTVYNVVRQTDVNDLNNLGLRTQIMYVPTDTLSITVAGDYTRQRARGYTQVVAGIAPTLRPANRQYPQIAADLGYKPPSFNAFDRLTDIDSPLRSNQDLGGASVNIDWKKGPGVLTSTSAWRFWDWDPANDRDFIGLPVTTASNGTSKQRQWTQEIRYAGDLSSRLNFVVGTFLYHQEVDSDPVIKQEQGSAAARFLLAPSANAATPGLLDGYGFDQNLKYRNSSAAVFGQVEFSLTNRLKLIPGLRFNYDQKDVNFDQRVYGGLQTTNSALIALQRSILAPQAYKADVSDNNVSGQMTVSYSLAENANVYATYATGFKSVGLNLNGVPTDAQDRPVLAAATVRPEKVRNLEFGLKTTPFRGATANFAVYNTTVRDFQAQVVNAGVGVLRGYLANAEKVRVRGAEFDGSIRVKEPWTVFGAVSFTDGRYISFPDAPPALEDTGGPQVKNISGSVLPGISKWATSFGTEFVKPGRLLGRTGEYFGRLDLSTRTAFSSSATYSRYLVADGYSLVNPRLGFRSNDGWALSVWARNLLNTNYYELLSAAPGNTGLFVGQPGDPRTFGVTLRRTFTHRDSDEETPPGAKAKAGKK